MGGGPVKKALLRFLERGGRVVISKRAAKTLRDDLSQLPEGIEVVEQLSEPDLLFSDLDFPLYRLLTENAKPFVEEVELYGFACQDHGFVKGQSDRVTRFNYLRQLFEGERRPERLVHFRPTGFLSRFDSILFQLRERGLKGFVMDSKVAAVAGVKAYAGQLGVTEFVCVDCGNGHTMVSTVKDGKVCGFLEHHTRMLNRSKLEKLTEKLVEGKLTFEEVYEDGGHGALVFEPIKPQKVFLVGPNRDRFKELGELAYPLGDAMLFGCAGLLEALNSLKV
jgi:uncharacterized protein (DUF1786 family)